MSSRPATPWLREGWGRVRAVEGLSVLSPPLEPGLVGPARSPDNPPLRPLRPTHLLAGVSTQAASRLRLGFPGKQRWCTPISGPWAPQLGQVHSST